MKRYYLFGMVTVASTIFALNARAEMPKITGTPGHRHPAVAGLAG
jgi:hypothetical protein